MQAARVRLHRLDGEWNAQRETPGFARGKRHVTRPAALRNRKRHLAVRKLVLDGRDHQIASAGIAEVEVERCVAAL
ncbi:MAG: hypothetical protein ACK55I_39805, partial [bacterium]